MDVLEKITFATMGDVDASPTKAWLITHRNDPAYREFYDIMPGKRPAEELYDLGHDPDQVNNAAKETAFTRIKNCLEARRMKTLREANDPRVVGDGRTFNKPPNRNPN